MPPAQERTNIKVQSERAILAAVRLPESVFDQANPFGELRALAEQAGAVVVGEIEQRRQKPESATYMGSGKVEELRMLCDELDASLVIFDHDLSPRQIRNMEEIVSLIPPEDDAADKQGGKGKKDSDAPKAKRRAVKIVDRSELILDIFASRATTHEAKLQVELAQMEYTYPRLRAMWDHLERITGAGGVGGIGTRGPGEQQLEIDRRLVQAKKLDLKRELDAIYNRKRRMVRDRKKDHFTVGIVGYTNAGKSTLFNALTAGGAYADDRVFATLVTRTREWDLGGGLVVMLSDTVGFVRDLPHHLIASFRATLEEATHADLLLIVLDVSDPAAELQYDTVIHTLDELEAEVRDIEEAEGNLPETHAWGEQDGWKPPQRVVLLNKADKLADNREMLMWERRIAARGVGGGNPASIIKPIPISAMDIEQRGEQGRGFVELRGLVLEAARSGVAEIDVTVPLADGKAIQRLENRGHVLSREYLDDGGHVRMHVRIGRRQLDQLKSGSPGLRIAER